MTLGAILAGTAVLLAIAALRGDSLVDRRVRVVASPRRRARRGRGGALPVRFTGALCGATCGCLVGWILGLGVLAVPIAAYAGLIVASLLRDRATSQIRDDADRATVALVEWLHALVASGRPIEAAFMRLEGAVTGSVILDAQLTRVRQDYALGVPLHLALARAGTEPATRALAQLAERVDRARDLGRGMLPVLQDLRDELRAAERSRALDAAGRVEGKLTLVLTLCYLPALALLVVIPLFLTLLAGLFA